MSDLTAYQVAADLADFLSDQLASITLPTGFDAPARVFASYGETDPRPCPDGEIAVWVAGIGPTDVPNRDVGIDQTACAAANYVEIVWRLTVCITKSTDGKTPVPVETLEAEAEAWGVLSYGLYRRVMARLGVAKAQGGIWDGVSCKSITGGRFELGQRAGGQLQATQRLRVQIDMTDPSEDSS